MTTCRLTLFGRPRLLDGGGRLISLPEKAYALVAYLVLTSRGEPAPRASLRQFLWEDSESKAAATNLRKFLSRVLERQEECGCELILSRRDHVELAKSVSVDLVDFLDVMSNRGPVDLPSFCDLYRGELLEGCDWSEPDVREWLTVHRAKLRDAFIGKVVGRLEPLDPDADKVALRIAARRLIEVDPYNEVGHRALMRLHADEGEPARVRDLFQSLERRLREDLRVSPDKATRGLYESLLPAKSEADAALPPPPASSRPAPAAVVADHDPAGSETHALTASDSSGAPKITVLPPPPIVGQSYGHQLASSLIEDITIGLCRSKGLSVVAPHTASELSQSRKKALFRTFGIDYAVETQLQNRGGEIWLSLKLLEAVSRKILWTDQYSLSTEQIARDYREMSVRILSSLIEWVERAELARYDKEQNPTAYRLYLDGQRHLRTLDLPHVRRARRAFKMALGICPDFVPTVSGLSTTLRLEWLLLARGDPDLLTEAKRMAGRSLELDPDDARGHRELGVCNLYSGRFEESLEAFRQAELRNPQFADLLVDFADALTHACEPSLGLQKVTEAIKLNPLCPDYYWWIAGGSNYHLHRYREAIECIAHMRDQTPGYRLMAASHARLGQRDEAAEYVRMVMEIHPDFSVSNWLSILPVRDPHYERDYEEGLREAGFD